MAKEKENSKSKTGKSAPKKKTLTFREQAAAASQEKPKRIRSVAGKAKKPIGKAREFTKSEFHIPLPDNKAGAILRKRVRIVPKFVSEAFDEIRQVTWPDRKSTVRLTIAVFIFAVIFSSLVGALDYVLGEIFKQFFVNN